MQAVIFFILSLRSTFMGLQSLSSDRLRQSCSPDSFSFENTSELSASTSIIGQPRGTSAIEFGIGIKSPGYNVFILGPAGTGRATAIERFLQEKTRDQPAPGDWIYVHNFKVPHQPRAIMFPPGQGSDFQKEMANLPPPRRRPNRRPVRALHQRR